MLTYEAMMDDQNHNNWEAAADSFRQPPPAPPLPPPPPPRPSSSIPDPGRELPGGQLLAVHAGSMERKGPKEGLPMGPPPLPEPNGVIMMLKSCDAAAAVAKTAPAPTSSSTININTSTSKFRESVPPPRPHPPPPSQASPHQLVESPRPESNSTSFVPGLVLFPSLNPPTLIRCLRPVSGQPASVACYTCAASAYALEKIFNTPDHLSTLVSSSLGRPLQSFTLQSEREK